MIAHARQHSPEADSTYMSDIVRNLDEIFDSKQSRIIVSIRGVALVRAVQPALLALDAGVRSPLTTRY